MRKTLMLSVSAIVMLAASQQALAIDKQAITSRPDLVQQQKMKPDVTIQQNTIQQNTIQQNAIQHRMKELPTAPAGTDIGAGIKSGAGIGKESGMGGIVPSGAMGKAQESAGGLKASHGQAKGMQAKEGPSGKQAEGMKKSIGEAAASRGKEKGVEGTEGASAKNAPGMQKAINDAAESRGQEKGVESQTGGGKLSKEQRQMVKDSTFDPKVNPQLGSQDPKGDGKGGATGGKPAPKPTGGTAGAKPTPKPAGGTTADKGGKGGKGGTAGGTGKVGGTAPVNKEKEKKEAMKVFDFAKPKEVKPIVFPADKITGKVPKGPKPEPKTDASNVTTDTAR